MRKDPRYRSHIPLSDRIRCVAVLLFSTVMLAFSAWTAIEAAVSGSILEFARHPNSILNYNHKPMLFGGILVIWVGLTLFFAAAMLGAVKQLRNTKI